MDASLAFAVELEQRDAALDGRLELLVDLGRRVREARARAIRLVRFLERLPLERESIRATLTEAEREVEAARVALEQARHAVDRARGEDAAATARRHQAHAATDARTTEDRRDRLVARGIELEQEAAAADAESRSLDVWGRELAAELAAAPRVIGPEPPAPGLDGLIDWGSRAQAAVLVARSGLATEREQVVREANELAASVLGEPLYTSSVAGVRERLERLLGRTGESRPSASP